MDTSEQISKLIMTKIENGNILVEFLDSLDDRYGDKVIIFYFTQCGSSSVLLEKRSMSFSIFSVKTDYLYAIHVLRTFHYIDALIEFEEWDNLYWVTLLSLLAKRKILQWIKNSDSALLAVRNLNEILTWIPKSK